MNVNEHEAAGRLIVAIANREAEDEKAAAVAAILDLGFEPAGRILRWFEQEMGQSCDQDRKSILGKASELLVVEFRTRYVRDAQEDT